MMTLSNFSITLLTDEKPQKVFQAITNVAGWWTGYYAEEINGSCEKLHDEFSFSAAGGAHYSKQKLVEVIPNQKLVWLITASDFSYVEKKDEWTGTKVIFEISENNGKTELTFTHEGLTSEMECYTSCAPSWSEYLKNKLLPLINT